MISCITEVALSSRSVASSRADPAQQNVTRPIIASKNITFFIEEPHFCTSAPHIQLRATYRVGQNTEQKCRRTRSIPTLANQDSRGLSNNAHWGRRAADWPASCCPRSHNCTNANRSLRPRVTPGGGRSACGFWLSAGAGPLPTMECNHGVRRGWAEKWAPCKNSRCPGY